MVKYKTIIHTIEQYTKSENGTRIPKKARTQLQKFTNEYADDLNQEHLGIYKNNGEQVGEIINGSNKKVTVPVIKIAGEGLTNLHLTHNHPTLISDGIPTMLTKQDCKVILEKSFDGQQYLFRSITAITPENHHNVTLIRNNDFSDKDIHKFNRATSKMVKKWKEYKSEFYTGVNREEIRLFQEHEGRNPTYEDMVQGKYHQEAVQLGMKKVGTLEQYLRKEGVYKDLERANMKLQIR